MSILRALALLDPAGGLVGDQAVSAPGFRRIAAMSVTSLSAAMLEGTVGAVLPSASRSITTSFGTANPALSCAEQAAGERFLDQQASGLLGGEARRFAAFGFSDPA
ncbi:hypothetical protein ACVBEG_27550 [Pseudomonas sp. GG8]